MAAATTSSIIRPGLVDWHYGSQYLGIGRTKYFELIKKGKLRAVRIDRRVLVEHDELDAFIARLRDESGAAS
jgi:excisionase family DNA binding protein